MQAPPPIASGKSASGLLLPPPPVPDGGWAWAFYDTLDAVRNVYNALDGGGAHPSEGQLRARLKERWFLFEDFMAASTPRGDKEAEAAQLAADGWLEAGHPYEGLTLTRVGVIESGERKGRRWTSKCRVVRWLPPKEAKRDAATGAVVEEPAMFHVVHEDGDEEDLWAEEAEAARRVYLENEATGGVPPDADDIVRGERQEEEEYVNKLERRAALRISRRTLGAEGLRDELLQLEEAPTSCSAPDRRGRTATAAGTRGSSRAAAPPRSSSSRSCWRRSRRRCATSKTWRPRPTPTSASRGARTATPSSARPRGASSRGGARRTESSSGGCRPRTTTRPCGTWSTATTRTRRTSTRRRRSSRSTTCARTARRLAGGGGVPCQV